MKEDIRQVRDEWAAMLSEKELEIKKTETSEALRIRTVKSELTVLH